MYGGTPWFFDKGLMPVGIYLRRVPAINSGNRSRVE